MEKHKEDKKDKEKKYLKMRSVNLYSVLMVVVVSCMLTSCVQGNLDDLMEEDEIYASFVHRKKSKQDFGGYTLTMEGDNWQPFPKSCAICCAAYYASDKKIYTSQSFRDWYHDIMNYVIYYLRPGFIPGMNGLTAPEIQQLIGKQYHRMSSRDEMYNEINSIMEANNASLSDFVIHGYCSSDEDHVAILSTLKKKRNGDIVIKTMDPGTYYDEEMSRLYGFFY